MSESKTELRRKLLDARATMPADLRHREDAALVAHVSYFLRSTRPKRVAAYVPGRTEPGGRLFLDAIHSEVPALILPLSLEDGRLDWALYQGPTNLVKGAFGIWEPSGPRLGPEALNFCDLIIAPALACTPGGIRLGKGGGFYDRALATGVRATVATTLYNGEIRDDIEVEDHDLPVNVIITPAGVRNLGAL
ncbi:5-formyltetrahydrofolate cyclo-ligase [Corynebacterium pacaense]|uniref:5-formyltetrahydrofolate cyclo-ligase n=1 Tax=Corynebacterium pacaense TaxID=1816684 RepID=UPI0009B9830E|nr:5-formyltetrahydrofolate cyclo-ligase [Corynebacterium pacaense]